MCTRDIQAAVVLVLDVAVSDEQRAPLRPTSRPLVPCIRSSHN